MNRLIPLFLLALICGCSTPKQSLVRYEPEPSGEVKTNPFDNYDAGIARSGKYPLAADWQSANKAKLNAALKPEVLDAQVASPAAADAFLANLKEAYATDPVVASQIAALSVRVMDKGREEARVVWSDALLRAAASASDPYRVCFCLDQLRWCGRASQIGAVRSLRRATPYREVAQLCDILIAELAR